mmetsp:Transcript_14067/g.23877  ORF Transcript_14067/g.23877 Transcript_14067/m.23877 type:complete len:92 (-) Transcript_14067:381-656(-)
MTTPIEAMGCTPALWVSAPRWQKQQNLSNPSSALLRSKYLRLELVHMDWDEFGYVACMIARMDLHGPDFAVQDPAAQNSVHEQTIQLELGS